MKQKEVIEEAIKEEKKENLKMVELDNEMLNKKIRNTGLFLQIVFVILVGICAIMSIFLNELLIVVEILLGLTLLIMAYNNYKIYRRSGLTCLYSIIGIVLLITSIYSYIDKLSL